MAVPSTMTKGSDESCLISGEALLAVSTEALLAVSPGASDEPPAQANHPPEDDEAGGGASAAVLAVSGPALRARPVSLRLPKITYIV